MVGNREFVIATCSNLGGFQDRQSRVAPLQPGGFPNDITVGSVGVNRSLGFISFGERHAKMLGRQEGGNAHI